MQIEIISNNVVKKYKESFIDYIDVSNETLKSYSNGIDRFIIYLNNNNISQPTRRDVINYRNELLENYASNTVNDYMVALRSMFRYLKSQGIYEDITVDVKGARVSTTPKTQVLQRDLTNEIYKSLTDKREKVIFGVLITTGLRGTELANAKLEDIKLHNNEITLWVQCKGHTEKDEFVKLSTTVMNDIKDYVGDRTSGYLIVGNGNKNNGDGVTVKTIRTIMKSIFKRFRIDEDNISLHTMRRTFATISYDLGADLKKIQQVLHHSNLQTTSRYVNASTRSKNMLEYEVADTILA